MIPAQSQISVESRLSSSTGSKAEASSLSLGKKAQDGKKRKKWSRPISFLRRMVFMQSKRTRNKSVSTSTTDTDTSKEASVPQLSSTTTRPLSVDDGFLPLHPNVNADPVTFAKGIRLKCFRKDQRAQLSREERQDT
jgi:hypothetical protein